MAFLIDKQTLADLQVFGTGRPQSVFDRFNRTHTRGGTEVLEAMFKQPFSDLASISRRSGIIRYFQQRDMPFPFQSEWFDAIEHFLANRDARTQLSAMDSTMLQKLKSYTAADTDYQQIAHGIRACIALLDALYNFVDAVAEDAEPAYWNDLQRIQQLLEKFNRSSIVEDNRKRKLVHERNVHYDRLFRFQLHEQLQQLLAMIYHLDVYITVAKVGKTQRFAFATALDGGNTLSIIDMFHPAVDAAVPNTVTMDASHNVLLLTGANMAGKSTLMKTLGITVFLAHMGFPVPASDMTFSVLDGMFTTINLADDISMGYSHFYAEVLRIKTVAQYLGKGKRLLVVVDELFRGTNVKDAYDGTIAVTEAFASTNTGFFVVSTHIIEAGAVLGERCQNIVFKYLPTEMHGERPHYTYRLKEGITADRHGMMIVKNEGIIAILESGKHEG
ncbi:MutS-related protein [Parapedobacter tibetensis]|uniref:MutS-related protein n=1 Tax=Parapedobacter tibetensis TaxID=2972951 RepID=UPI00214D3C46|nr:DNA mismatch repair protein [Parapedobacter tibetensis]